MMAVTTVSLSSSGDALLMIILALQYAGMEPSSAEKLVMIMMQRQETIQDVLLIASQQKLDGIAQIIWKKIR